MRHEAKHGLPVPDASGGSIFDKKKAWADSPRHPDLVCLGRTQSGWRGFSSYGHRLSSLYRDAIQWEFRLTDCYVVEKTCASSRSKYSNPTFVSGARGGA